MTQDLSRTTALLLAQIGGLEARRETNRKTMAAAQKELQHWQSAISQDDRELTLLRIELDALRRLNDRVGS